MFDHLKIKMNTYNCQRFKKTNMMTFSRSKNVC